MKKSKKKSTSPRPIRWPADFGDDFDDRLKAVVAGLNRKYAGTPRYRPLSLNRFIVDAVRKELERQEKVLDSPGG